MRWMIQAALMAAVLCAGCTKNGKTSKKPETAAVPAAPIVIPASHEEVVELKAAVAANTTEISLLNEGLSSHIEGLRKTVEKLVPAPEAPVVIPATKEHVDSKLDNLKSLVGSLQVIFASAHENVGSALESLKTTATATQTNTELTNAKIDEQDSRLRNLETTAANIDENVAEIQKQIQSFLESQAAPAAAVPKKPPVPIPAPAAPPKDVPDRSVAMVAVEGQLIPIDDFIATWFKTMWTHPGSIDQHLLETHAVSPEVIAMLDKQTKEKLHSAIHEKERADGLKRSVVKSKTETRVTAPAAPAPAGSSMNCPNGRCPLVAPSTGIVTQEVRQFTRRRAKGKPVRGSGRTGT